MNLGEFWQTERRFLTQIAAGLAVFLILYAVIDSWTAGASEKTERRLTENDQLQRRVEQMIDYNREIGDRDALDDQLTDLLARVAIKAPDISETEATETQFKKAKSAMYNAVMSRAGQVNLQLPKIADIRFDVDDLSFDEWCDRYATLDVVRQALDACVEHRVRKVEEVEPLDVEVVSIAEDSDSVLVRHSIRLELTVRYVDLLAFIDSFQSDGRFLAAEMESVEKTKGNTGYVTAELLVSGIGIGEPREEKRGRSSRGRRSPRGRG